MTWCGGLRYADHYCGGEGSGDGRDTGRGVDGDRAGSDPERRNQPVD
jgi:hypothetical protein